MIVDSSAVLAVLYREPDAERYETAIAAAPNCRMSVANVLEVSIVVEGRGGGSRTRRIAGKRRDRIGAGYGRTC